MLFKSYQYPHAGGQPGYHVSQQDSMGRLHQEEPHQSAQTEERMLQGHR